MGNNNGQYLPETGIPVYDDNGEVIGFREPEEGELPAPSTPKYFPDVPADAWYAEAVNAMAQTGFILGRDDGLFYPDALLTEGEWATILWRIVGGNIAVIGEGSYVQAGSTRSTHWASCALSFCHDYGYVNAVWSIKRDTDAMNQYLGADGNIVEFVAHKAGTYIEDQYVNRGEAASAIMKIIADGDGTGNTLVNSNQNDLSGKLAARQRKNGAKTDWTLAAIPDADVIEANLWHDDYFHRWDVDSIVKAYNLGVLNGIDTSGTCNPTGLLTRAQACQMLYNALILEPRPIRGRNSGLYG